MDHQCIDGVKRQKIGLIYIERRVLGSETWNNLTIRGLEKSMKETKKNRNGGGNSIIFLKDKAGKCFIEKMVTNAKCCY